MLSPKDYRAWTKIKTSLHNNTLDSSGLNYHEGDIYWMSIGQNIGWEQDGKGDLFMRPVLVLQGYSRRLFHGVPLTSKPHDGRYYYPIQYSKGHFSYAILSQSRTFDVSRIRKHNNYIGRIEQQALQEIKRRFRQLFS